MVCKNCGAPIEAQLRVCPYCGAENEQLAAADQQAELQGIFARIARLLHLPQRTAQKAARVLKRAGRWMAVLFALALLAALVWSLLAPRLELRRQQRALQQLEQLYAAQDYAGVRDMMYELEDGYRAVYEKYSITAELFDGIGYLEEFSQETVEVVAGFPQGADLLDYDLRQLFALLLRCRQLQQAGYVCGEQAAAEAAQQQALRYAQQVYLFTDSEIEQGIAEAQREEPDYSALRAVCLQHLLESVQ